MSSRIRRGSLGATRFALKNLSTTMCMTRDLFVRFLARVLAVRRSDSSCVVRWNKVDRVVTRCSLSVLGCPRGARGRCKRRSSDRCRHAARGRSRRGGARSLPTALSKLPVSSFRLCSPSSLIADHLGALADGCGSTALAFFRDASRHRHKRTAREASRPAVSLRVLVSARLVRAR